MTNEIVSRKRPIRRRRKRGKNKKPYFGKAVQAAIVSYQQEPDPEIQEKLYVKEIMPAFEQLAENLIMIYGFNKNIDNFDQLKFDCIAFLYEKIYKWNPEKGTKAFSYYNVVAKNFLIVQSKNAYKKKLTHVSLSNPKGLSYNDKEIINGLITPDAEMQALQIEANLNIINLLNEIKIHARGKNENLCIDAIIHVFGNIDNLELLSKRAILIYIREISGLNPKQLSAAMSRLRKVYKKYIGTESRFDIFV